MRTMWQRMPRIPARHSLARSRSRASRAQGSAGRTRRVSRLTRAVVAALAAIMLVVSSGALWYQLQADPLGGTGATRLVAIQPGWTVTRAAQELKADKVIGSVSAFRAYLILTGGVVVSPGTYVMREREPFDAVKAALLEGPPVKALVVPPGGTISLIARRVARIPAHTAAAFTSAATSGRVRSAYEPAGIDNLEGLLYPATYSIGIKEGPVAILKAMVARFDAEASLLHLTQMAARLGVTPYEGVIVASIVEKEALLPADKAKVARVIYNRLAAGMPLQMDSTVYYGLAAAGRPVSRLTTADLRFPSQYNTYAQAGLPPTPIASPDASALRAALNPAPGKWMYFVTVSRSGKEAFSVTYSEQLANERIARSRGLLGG